MTTPIAIVMNVVDKDGFDGAQWRFVLCWFALLGVCASCCFGTVVGFCCYTLVMLCLNVTSKEVHVNGCEGVRPGFEAARKGTSVFCAPCGWRQDLQQTGARVV